MSSIDFDNIIIGGGPAGSIAAIALAAAGMKVAIFEKKTFPREVLCGEFLSHEVLDTIIEYGFLNDFMALHPRKVTRFRFVTEDGNQAFCDLGFDGYAIQRSRLDQLLLSKAASKGVSVLQPTEVINIHNNECTFEVQFKIGPRIQSFVAHNVIAAYGRQNTLDRNFEGRHSWPPSDLLGLKYHIPKSMLREWNENEIQVYSASGIYCGINSVSDDVATLCYLTDSHLHHEKPTMALQDLFETNRAFRELFVCDLLPFLLHLRVVGAGNIYLGKRNVVEKGVYMVGDAAGVIAPLVGDGIGMAMESGKLIARVLDESRRRCWSRKTTEQRYDLDWNRLFSHRLTVAKYMHKAVLNSHAAHFAGAAMSALPVLTQHLIQWTRG